MTLAATTRAEDVSKRAKLPSSTMRLRGATGLVNTPSGMFAMGGSRLRHLAPGAKSWDVLLDVKGQNLYRVAENRGLVLASYENEPHFHLIDLQSRAHKTIAKPPRPTGIEGFQDWRLDSLAFAEDGLDALVYMWAAAYTARTGSYIVHAAYRVPLAGDAPPTQLFQDVGFTLDQSKRGSVLLKPKSWALGCSHSGCPVDKIVAYEFAGARTSQRLLFDAQGKGVRYDSAQIVPSTRAFSIAAQITGWNEKEKKRTRGLLRYTYGQEPLYHALSETSSATFDLSLLARNNEYIEGRQGEDKAVTLTRVKLDGTEVRNTIAAWGDEKGRPAKAWLTSIRERKNGDLWMHWGDNLVIVNNSGARKVDVGGFGGRSAEWAGSYIYVEDPEAVWFGLEMGGGRDYIRVDFAALDRSARPWQPATVSRETVGPMPPAVTNRLEGRRSQRNLGGGVLSIGDTNLYYRDDPKQPWRLLYALPDRTIYRMQVDEAGGRILAHWSSERQIHLFEPAASVHKTFPWPSSDVAGFSAGLQHLFFDPNGQAALVFMHGLVSGNGNQSLNEFYQVPFDGGAATRLYRHEGHRLHVSERGATFIKPTKNQGHCNVRYCVLDGIFVVELINGRATSREIFRSPSYTDHASIVSGSNSERVAVMVNYSDPINARNPVKVRALLRFGYGNNEIRQVLLPAFTIESVKRNFLTTSGDYIEFIDLDEKMVLQMHIHPEGREAQVWDLPADRSRDIDAGPDGGVHGFGQRADGSFWLHWGDRILLLSPGSPARAMDIGNQLKRGEWASADRYNARPETLTIGIDIGGGRTFIDVPFATIEKNARRIGR
ncbi:MAG: hypothetical protein SF187_12135 [Deltaproteobacteria bacterium]|nr:hypothetical protein [Deltaproteobacteria bacterium]